MSVINNFPAVPNRFGIVCEYLHFVGEGGDTAENVCKQLSPLKEAGEETVTDDVQDGSSIAELVLSEMEKLKLVNREGRDLMVLAPEVMKIASKDGNWQAALKPLLLSRMIFPEVASSMGQRDVPDALSWLLAQDPLDPLPFKGGVHVERTREQLEEGDPLMSVIRNNQRFQNLIYWARYFGFAERVVLKNDVIVPDPTRVVTSLLPMLFHEKKELPIQVFVQRLADACPVLDGGPARRELERRLSLQLRPNERHLSRSTSLSLLRLRKRGVLEYRAVSDANTWVLDVGSEASPISHISLRGGMDA